MEEAFCLLQDEMVKTREREHHQQETSQQQTRDHIIVLDRVRHRVASHAITLHIQFRMQQSVIGKKALPVVMREIDVSSILYTVVSR